MTIFDLVFLASFLVSVVALIAAVYAAIRGYVPRAFTILGVWWACAIVYLGISVAVAYAAPQRVIPAGTPWCFDDWCLTVENAKRADTNYNVDLRISSEAKRVTQRANGAWIYLRDENDTHYNPTPNPEDDLENVPLDVLLQPGESVAARRSFHVPANIHELGLVTGHSGPPCGWMSLVIIGQGGCLFHKQTMIRLPLEY
ncbi:MAG: hypothetical protein LAP61_02650 [Acidobacteriia bacterium]|nr:hypothetical protein [Terriglobia bacterium]